MWFNLVLSLKGKTKLTQLPALGEPILILVDCHEMLKKNKNKKQTKKTQPYSLAIF